MKNTTTLLLFTTSITTIFAMDVSETTSPITTSAATSPVFISPQEKVLKPDVFGVFSVLSEHLSTTDLLNLSTAQGRNSIPGLQILRERLEKRGIRAELIEGVPPQRPLVPRLSLKGIISVDWENRLDIRTRSILFKYYGDKIPWIKNNLRPDRIHRRLADAGWLKLQSDIAKSLALGLDPIGLRRCADAGWKRAQAYVVSGLTMGEFGFKKDPEELKRCADAGWTAAQDIVIGRFDTKSCRNVKKPSKKKNVRNRIISYANTGSGKAQELMARGLNEGSYGFKKNLKQLKRRADAGCVTAQKLIVNKLKRAVTDHEEIRRCADAGWRVAQDFIVSRLALDRYGFAQDPEALRRCADAGWPEAQKLVAKGLALGKYGIEQDGAELRRLAIQYARDPYSPYVKRFIRLEISERNIFQFFIDADRASQEISF